MTESSRPRRSHPRTVGHSSSPSAARVAAASVLDRVLVDDAFADLALDAELTARRPSTRDAALATELVYGTLRWQRYLDWLLDPHLHRNRATLDPWVLVNLRMAVYQLVFLDRIPAFAAVHDAVSLVRRRTRPGTDRFVNAVLRSLTRRSPAEREPEPPRDPIEALAVRFSFPTWLAARWVEQYGLDEAATLMAAMNDRPPLTIRANTLRITRDALAQRLTAEDGLSVALTRYAPEGLVVTQGGVPSSWSAFSDGSLVLQDEASMLIARLLEVRPGDTVADACAAPGTKTTHLAQLMENRGRIIALDPQPTRLARVGDACVRLGIGIVDVHAGTAQDRAEEFANVCDGVLVDAPCSNLGVLRRNPDVKWRRAAEDIAVTAARQRKILAAAARMVRPGGCLVYATCSLEPAENEMVAAAFRTEAPGFVVDPPRSFPFPLDPDGVLRCRPHRHGTDGFTAVRFRRIA